VSFFEIKDRFQRRSFFSKEIAEMAVCWYIVEKRFHLSSFSITKTNKRKLLEKKFKCVENKQPQQQQQENSILFFLLNKKIKSSFNFFCKRAPLESIASASFLQQQQKGGKVRTLCLV
jgi:hypothetical protein